MPEQISVIEWKLPRVLRRRLTLEEESLTASRSVQRIWAIEGLQPGRIGTFKRSNDREFVVKLARSASPL